MEMPKPYHWIEYKNDAGEPAARCMRVFDATLWQIWTPHSPPVPAGMTGYWSSPPVVVRDVDAPDAHRLIERSLKALESELMKLQRDHQSLNDVVEYMNDRASAEPSDFKPTLRERISAALSAWKEGQH
jgi:hypothetical protein